MAVVRIRGAKVVEVFRDVETAEDAEKKYGSRPGTSFEVGDHPPGTRFVGGVFVPPVVPPKQRVEDRGIQAIRLLAEDAAPQTKAAIIAIIGQAPVNPGRRD